MARALRALVVVAGAAVLLFPAPAQAHSILRVRGGEIFYDSPDAVSRNTLTVSREGSEIEFLDPTVDGGLDPGPCRPGEVNDRADVVQVFCPAAGIERVRIDVYEREDSAVATILLPLAMSGGDGADRLTGAGAADALAGDAGDDRIFAGWGDDRVDGGLGADLIEAGPGNDVVDPGEGLDTVSGDDGDDRVLVRDGVADTVRCGAGTDYVEVDAFDTVAADCEEVARLPGVTPSPPAPSPGTPTAATPTGATPTAIPVAAGEADRRPPAVRARARKVQRVGVRGAIRLVAISSEPGSVAASGYVQVRGLSLPIAVRRAPVDRAGAAVRLTMRLPARARREAARAWRRGRRVVARLSVVATDEAGNSARVEAPAIRLVR